MRICYLLKLDKPIRLEDYWPIPILDGQLNPVSQDGKIIAFKITFIGQPLSLSPKLEVHEHGKAKASITDRDSLLPFVSMQVEKAFSYLRCYFDTEILIDEIETAFEGETDEEIREIQIEKLSTGKAEHTLEIPYSMLTMALMAAESGPAPEFEATLVAASRKAMTEKRFIDSFRYSFLLIESLYGDGKFKSVQLKAALKANPDLHAIITEALSVRTPPTRPRNSDTEKLLSQSPTVNRVIDHLVDMRGFYFHGNRKRGNAWQPHEQDKAEVLCLLALEISMLISHEAAAPMFAEEHSKRHFEQAKNVGATMAMKVSFMFRDPDEKMDRNGTMRISVPGTRPTQKLAAYVAKSFLQRFEDEAPTADLKSAICTVDGTEEKIFEITLHAHLTQDKSKSETS
ncbi:hypothetical protein EOI86_05580 [Hwanghaeella grinnelliae]|uniref:Uncharacterized protein n=1 Tax=Hwanghaeella grinnelliae TaxID=2500179 RepID=A0A3S2Y523_9PROT|nr:hypothetical protein [Hwanghaeella grinnelliae]RVU38742.1 hypothetical protein EOI86_05580 [Hwanghaeella grinnelliae]